MGQQEEGGDQTPSVSHMTKPTERQIKRACIKQGR